MRLMHTSDLHIGKSVHGLSMLDDQKHILEQMLGIIENEKVDALIIAGDVYDKTVPNEGAVSILNGFLTRLHEINCPVFIIPGNHDSATRISFGSTLLAKQGVHIAEEFAAGMEKHVLKDEFGDLNVYLLPFFKPSMVRSLNPKAEINNADDAAREVLRATEINSSERNILVAHQFVISRGTDLDLGGSEEYKPSVGGVDCISYDIFSDFDYVALGHIHRPQKVGRSSIRYCGSPLKYSEKEDRDEKGVVILDIGEKGAVSTRNVPLVPIRDLRVVTGTVEQLKERSVVESGNPDDYIYVNLTEDTSDARAKLAEVYPNIMGIAIVSTTGGGELPEMTIEKIRGLDPVELFRNFYEDMNGEEIGEKQEKIFSTAFERAMEDLQ
ncbi:MAG: exonuclease SbcCD subunit D [Mesotoga sp.]|uniref:exonuclease SbcCD subunit D n=1 Tax=Mesotoga sp. TaxID=2053577 RepID=UPI002A6DAD2A|nr:exonuclease SbcCD subunit D [Candidatus Methanomethylophilaceae archaeon]MDD4454685.1 exonuclease SbcCD subunit D [Candidatus Methanomethylophilaceae archaeon]